MAKPTNYSPEYKKEIIKLITEQGKSHSQVAKSVGVNDTTIRKWVKQFSGYGKDAFPGKGNLKPDDEELKDLKNKIKYLEMENEILKIPQGTLSCYAIHLEAMSIFSRDVKINTK